MNNRIIKLGTNTRDNSDSYSNLTLCDVNEEESKLNTDDNFDDFLFYAGKMIYKKLKTKAA